MLKFQELNLNSINSNLKFINDKVQIYNENAMYQLNKIEEKTIDIICTDLPYGCTKNKWDLIIPVEYMWEKFNKIIKDNGVIVLTATQPFASILIGSNLDNFKYDLIWEKTISSGQLNVKNQPLRSHEHILVFYKQKPTYNEQKMPGTPYSINRKVKNNENNYNKQKDSFKVNDGFRHAKSVIKISNPRIKGGHPTQKPIELIDYILKTYSNENDLVLDCCMGSGTTAESAIKLNRRFYGIEILESEYNKTLERINAINALK